MSQGPHLDEKSFAALLEKPGDHPELVAHLSTECEICEAFLSAHKGPGVLDGHLDAALLSLAARSEAPLDEVGFARLRRSLAPAPRRSRWPLAAAALLAAGLLLALWPRPSPDDGVKGPAAGSVELHAVWRAPDGALEPVGPGASVPARGALLFRARSPRSGLGLLLVQRSFGEAQLLHQIPVASGLEDLRSEAGALGFSLEGESGPVVVWLVVGDARTPPSLESAREALHSAAHSALAVGRFELNVTP